MHPVRMEIIQYKERLIDQTHICELCNHEVLEEAREMYYRWIDNKRISTFCQIPEEEVIKHAKAFLWDVYRPQNTQGVYESIIREGLPILLENPEKIGGKIVYFAAKQIDVINGNEKAKQKNGDPNEDRTALHIIAEMTKMLKQGHKIDDVISVFKDMIPKELTDRIRVTDDQRLILADEN
jgi:hypothetical protein